MRKLAWKNEMFPRFTESSIKSRIIVYIMMATSTSRHRSGALNSVIILLLLTHFLSFVNAAEKSYCNVCRAVVDEANWKIAQADPKRMIEVGSFRVDSEGNQKIKQKTFARSEGHVEEILESICNRLEDYAEHKGDDGALTFVRTIGRNGKRLDTQNVNMNLKIEKKLVHLCHNFLEDHEEAVISVLQKEDVIDYQKVICGDEISVCTEKELSIPMIELPEFEEPSREEEDNEDEGDENPEPEEDIPDSESEEEEGGEISENEAEGLKDEL